MIHPSYSELIEAIHANNEDDDNTMLVNSRYSLVLATSKRARQIIAGAKPLVEGANGKKPLSTAIDEIYKGKVKILEISPEEAEQQEAAKVEGAAGQEEAIGEISVEETAQETPAEETTEE